ncbi:hypothetical protein PVAND_010879 [Polypedilum vanderplanki]|uniref:Chitin-binding type-2 domain-containing protein n=1 Tax=Polypedilum vanderplanki TaxID=319348 RepID=A0A9J6CI79_POLVA|nr:hypothetical protein PVAND_010879 [Polypedilum vanderplanki]
MGNIVKLLLIIGIILFGNLHCCSAKKLKPSPKIVAQRTGAVRFEEYIDDENASHETKLRKRYSNDPDIEPSFANDPEIYQGVLGRPGVDFPVMPSIPKTGFDCHNLGNGYFADLETSCQVFHICDEGRKISFLCPNGTIFRQIDLICDWWFKVDCNAAPHHYAESSEQLQRAQRLRQQSQKLRHVVQSELGFGTSGEVFRNDARAAESIQKPTVRLPQGRAFRAPNSKLNKRMDNNEQADDANRQSLDASEILYNRRNARKEKTNEPKELQETAESASFVNNKNGYNYKQPEGNGYEYPVPNGYQYLPPQQAYSYPKENKNGKVGSKKPVLQDPQPFNTRPTERPSEMFASTIATLDVASTSEKNKVGKSLEQQVSTTEKPQPSKSTASAKSTTVQRGSTTYASSLKATENKEPVRSRVQASNSVVSNNNNNIKTTTPSYDSQKISTYTTARKPSAKTKETPFYTPTIPTIRETQPALTTLSSTTPTPEVATKPTNSEIVKHALEMMESLKELDMEDVIPTEAEKYMGNRVGLEVPPSSGPNALHSLALYFANGDTNNTKRMIQLQNGISSVFLSNKTQTKYEALFPSERKPTDEPIAAAHSTTNTNDQHEDVDNDLETQHSKHPILSAAGTPQLREIAQVFTHALSAYLQDPEQFRKILSEIRPTEPPNVQFNEIPRFVGENEFVRQESAYNVPRQAANLKQADDLEIFEFSDSTPKAKEIETTTENNEILTTTDANIITTTYYPETFPTTNIADKTPASRLVTDTLEKSANLRNGKQIDSISLRLTAGEINSNLENVRYGLDDSKEEDGTNYFPETRNDKSQLSPYGFGVKPENSTPISDPYPTSLADTQAVPLHWGDELVATTTNDPLSDYDQPTVYAELLPPYDINGTEVFGIPSNRLQLPNEETDEHLQHAQSQSIVASRNGNNIYSDEKRSKTYNDYLNYNEEFLLGTTNFGEKITTTTEITPAATTQTTIRGHFVTKAVTSTTQAPETTTYEYPTTTNYPTTLSDTGKINANSKTTLSYTVFLDPLTINDGLMEDDEDDSVTPSPNTYLPRSSELLSSTEEVEPLTTSTASAQRRGKSSAFTTTPLTIRFNSDESNIIEPMQKRANEMFGKLNETQVNHLMNVMKKAEENKTVKRLILLLIQTCDGDDHNKTLEASRTALLNALIGMDDVSTGGNDRSEFKIVNTRREKSLRTTTTTASPPLLVTTYKSPNHEKYTSSETVSKELEDSEATALPLEQSTNLFSAQFNEFTTIEQDVITTTEFPTTTSTTTTTQLPISDSKPKFRLKSNSQLNVRHQKSLGSSDRYQSEPTNALEHKKADARALELLRSLYSLASRWGRK